MLTITLQELFLTLQFLECTSCIACHAFKPDAYFHLQETQKRPAKTALVKGAKKQKLNNARTAKSTRTNKSDNVGTDNPANGDNNKSAKVGISNSANVGTNKLANVGISKSANVDTIKSTSVGITKSDKTNKSTSVGTIKLANIGTNKSAKVGSNKSVKVVTNKSANVGTIKSAKTGTTTKRGKQQKSPVRKRKPGAVREGKRVASPRNSKKTTTKTEPKHASRSLGKERTKKEVNGKSAIAPEDINGEQRERVEDDKELSEDNLEDTAPLADTKRNGTVEENGEETDSDSITSIRRDEQLTHKNTVPSAGSDSDTQEMDHESNKHTTKTIGTGPHELDDDTGCATAAGNDSSSGSERSCTPLSNYISKDSGEGCKITIKKTSNGFISGDECGVISRQQGQSGDCSEIAITRKSVVSTLMAMTAIASGVVVDCKTDGSTVDHDDVSHMKSDTQTDVVSDSEVGGPSESTLSDVVSVSKTDKTVVGSASCCQTDNSSETYDVPSRCKTDNDPDVHDVAMRFEADAPALTDHAMSDCETDGPGELAEPGHNEESEPETNTATPAKTDVSVVSTEEASSNVPRLIFSCHSKHTDSNSLPTEKKDQSFAKPERENQEIDTAEKSPSELLAPSDDDTEVQNNNVTSPTPDEPIRLVYV